MNPEGSPAKSQSKPMKMRLCHGDVPRLLSTPDQRSLGFFSASMPFSQASKLRALDPFFRLLSVFSLLVSTQRLSSRFRLRVASLVFIRLNVVHCFVLHIMYLPASLVPPSPSQ